MNEVLKIAYDALDEKKGEKIKIIDISEISVIADYFIIVNGTNSNQLDALTENVEEKLSKAGVGSGRFEGMNTDWRLLDYGDIVIHIFTRDTREFYDLERIWSDGKEVEV